MKELEKMSNYLLEGIKKRCEEPMEKFKYSDLSSSEKETLKVLTDMFNHEGGWAETGKEDWDMGATLLKNKRIGIFAPIKF